jgi:hypothetical protein
VLEGEEEAVITALDMEDAWKKEVEIYSSFVASIRIRIWIHRICTYVVGPPGSGFFYHQAKIVRKTMINVPSKSNKQSLQEVTKR